MTRHTRRKPSKSENRKYQAHGEALLEQAAKIWDAADYLDTAVRDGIAEGLGYLVHAAYDSIANSMNIPDTTAWMAFIDNATAEWFRERGFAEWFCLAAASQFFTSRPRVLSEMIVRRVRPKRKAAA